MIFSKLLKTNLLLSLFIISSCAYFKPVGKGRDVEVTKKRDHQTIDISERDKEVKIEKREVIVDENLDQSIDFIHIHSLSIAVKSNGTIIKLGSYGKLPKENIAVSTQESGNVNITFYKGKFSSAFAQNINKPDYVKDIHIFEFEESVQVTIIFQKPFSSNEVITNKNGVIISLFN